MTPAQAKLWHNRSAGGVTIWVTYGTNTMPVASITNSPRGEPPDLHVVQVVCAPGNVAKRATMECSGVSFDEVLTEAEGFIKVCGWDLCETDCRAKKKG